jgi:uncharacterized protein YciI
MTCRSTRCHRTTSGDKPAHRCEHLRLAWQAQRGEIVLAAALADRTDQALLLLQGEDDSAARAFAESDPYVKPRSVTR